MRENIKKQYDSIQHLAKAFNLQHRSLLQQIYNDLSSICSIHAFNCPVLDYWINYPEILASCTISRENVIDGQYTDLAAYPL